MKNILLTALLVFGSASFAMHHEKSEETASVHANNSALLSTYGLAKGSAYAPLQRELIQYQKDQMKAGFNACGLYRHEFGEMRGFYTFCYFDDLYQLAKIMDNEEPNLNEKQNFDSHTDHIVAIVEKHMTIAPNYILNMRWNFDMTTLTLNEAAAEAKGLFDHFLEAFGACNLYDHQWGPENAWYMSCGFDDYKDFADKANKIYAIIGEKMGDKNMHVISHSDDLLVRVDLK